jgi:hypothetical protein
MAVAAEFRDKILSRDGRCVVCKTRAARDPHHIHSRGARDDDSYANGITLCRRCHNLFHSGVLVLAREGDVWILMDCNLASGNKTVKNAFDRRGSVGAWRDVRWKVRSSDEVVVWLDASPKTIRLCECETT